MYQCKYCGRYLKEAYDNCPGCGSNKFDKISNFGTTKITKVPDGGYKINLNNYKKDNLAGILLMVMGTIFLSISVVTLLTFGSASLIFSSEIGFLSFGFLPFIIDIPFIIIGFFILKLGLNLNKKHKEKLRKVKNLAHNGILIKNLNYTVKKTGTIINGQPVYCIEVIYENANGTKIPLTSEGKYDGRLSRGDGTVDLLIDPNDTSNYFIDFEIY